MAGEIVATIATDASPAERRSALDRFLFQENGFHGSRAEYYHPANSHLDRVIDDREGLPITLSVLYIELGRRIGIDIRGIGLPGHFVAQHRIDDETSVLIDVFDRGKELSRDDAARMVAMHSGRRLRETDLAPSSTPEILTRVLNNLIGIAGRNEDAESMLRYSDAIVAINPDNAELRLMRARLRRYTGRNQAALEDVRRLLDSEAEGSGGAGFSRQSLLQLRSDLQNRVEADDES